MVCIEKYGNADILIYIYFHNHNSWWLLWSFEQLTKLQSFKQVPWGTIMEPLATQDKQLADNNDENDINPPFCISHKNNQVTEYVSREYYLKIFKFYNVT